MTNITHVVVDGSNIATEGRSIPSLAQLESAVVELEREMPGAEVIVVVDATFAHRIEADERGRFEEAALRGAYVYPPAGAIGRGDAFLLRIAQKIDATVLSNDSFQEFHGEHEWLFDAGRLIGATPVPGVGWIFVPRSPVRGPKSRIAVRDSQRSKTKVEKAIAAATKEAVTPEAPRPKKSKKKGDAPPAEDRGTRRTPLAVNDPLTFISFVAEHPLGDEFEGEVESFTSHGAIVAVGEMRCYVPLSGLGDPAPRSAREVLHREERRSFVLTALDPQRRGVELALPEAAVVSGVPSEETVEAEVAMSKRKAARGAKAASAEVPESAPAGDGRAPKRGRSKKDTSAVPTPLSALAPTPTPEAALEPAGEASKGRARRGRLKLVGSDGAGAEPAGGAPRSAPSRAAGTAKAAKDPGAGRSRAPAKMAAGAAAPPPPQPPAAPRVPGKKSAGVPRPPAPARAAKAAKADGVAKANMALGSARAGKAAGTAKAARAARTAGTAGTAKAVKDAGRAKAETADGAAKAARPATAKTSKAAGTAKASNGAGTAKTSKGAGTAKAAKAAGGPPAATKGTAGRTRPAPAGSARNI